ncbi:MtnX-like HAD-IB family phosphatase [candidate division FCPU426 bacterium]|nr:MtnX-like HAD-IB family phosphatase [candidate division FCPU426 bacterium]
MNTEKILISDFDGTMTGEDFYECICRCFPHIKTELVWRKYTQGRITHFEAMQKIFAQIRAPEEEMDALLHGIRLDHGLKKAIDMLKAGGWRIVVVSVGSDWYIKRLFMRDGLDVEIHSNKGEYHPRTGLLIQKPLDSPYFDEDYGVSKSAAVRAALQHTNCVAFAGDGRTDEEPAKLVDAACRFARGWLAEHFIEQKEKFKRFSSWNELAEILLTGGDENDISIK